MKSTKVNKDFDIFINGKKTNQAPAESFRNLLNNGSFLQALENLNRRVENIEQDYSNISEILKYHGLELPNQRSLKVI